MMKRIILPLMLSLTLLSSCYLPARISVSPGVKGRVIDRLTSLPIVGAKISLEKSGDVSAYSDENGYFEICPKKEWAGFMIMGVGVDYAYMEDRLVVIAEGFHKFPRFFRFNSRSAISLVPNKCLISYTHPIYID
jgi:hypothetical protein